MEFKLNIDEEIYEKLKERAEKLGFNSIEKYIVHIILEKLNPDENDEEKIAKKLEELGYM
ncbi:MAG: hypothetical protein GF401_08075 [Chitinivibrionales bacterium]|nr:hypothetical protein [Chitinivibrionales bacterium]